MQEELVFTVPEEYDGAAVQSFLRRGCGMSSRMLARFRRVEKGILADGVPLRTIDPLRAGQRLVLRLPEDAIHVEPVALPLSVIYEDDSVLVVDKPPYLAVHPSAGKPDPTLAAAVVAHYQKQGRTLAFRPLNRLDRNTSGLLLAAKNAHAAFALSPQNPHAGEHPRVRKEYLAIVLGALEGEGVIDQPIRVREGSCITREVGEGGKPSLTRWRALAGDGELTLLRVVIDTGRTHQIRVHMAWLGYPLAGDTMYGSDQLYLPRQGLHCALLEFCHPMTGEMVRLTSGLPSDMRDLLSGRGFPLL
ncbi:MAG: RluA family pseudouridine synthase [Clostridiales bacterium]|nr:RluA family pseudouridine synthase [Clostridiales bacterium]